MMYQGALRRFVAITLVAGHLALASGCATLAHRSSVSGKYVRSTAQCTGAGDTCPWIWGDAGLLLLGVVPGVVAFIVDFSNGAIHHNHPTEVRDARDEVASAHLLFSPPNTNK
jgi:hypothetical protein